MNSGIHQWTCPGLMNKPTDKDQMHLSSDSVAITYFPLQRGKPDYFERDK